MPAPRSLDTGRDYAETTTPRTTTRRTWPSSSRRPTRNQANLDDVGRGRFMAPEVRCGCLMCVRLWFAQILQGREAAVRTIIPPSAVEEAAASGGKANVPITPDVATRRYDALPFPFRRVAPARSPWCSTSSRSAVAARRRRMPHAMRAVRRRRYRTILRRLIKSNHVWGFVPYATYFTVTQAYLHPYHRYVAERRHRARLTRRAHHHVVLEVGEFFEEAKLHRRSARGRG